MEKERVGWDRGIRTGNWREGSNGVGVDGELRPG